MTVRYTAPNAPNSSERNSLPSQTILCSTGERCQNRNSGLLKFRNHVQTRLLFENYMR